MNNRHPAGQQHQYSMMARVQLLSVVNKLRAGLIKSKSNQQDEANSLNAKIKKGKKKAKKKKLKPI